jgi:hypothetical protein
MKISEYLMSGTTTKNKNNNYLSVFGFLLSAAVLLDFITAKLLNRCAVGKYNDFCDTNGFELYLLWPIILISILAITIIAIKRIVKSQSFSRWDKFFVFIVLVIWIVYIYALVSSLV